MLSGRSVWLVLFVIAPAISSATVQSTGEEELLRAVSERLIGEVGSPQGSAWPPSVIVSDTACGGGHQACVDRRTGTATVGFTSLFMNDVVENDPHRLAFVVGHELGHILLSHSGGGRRSSRTALVSEVFSRAQELAADVKGLELALMAGYQGLTGARNVWRRMEDLGLEYSSFEGLDASHPSWKERLANLDKEQSSLWRAMSAFHDGTYFLVTEHYGTATRAFRSVVKEFPASHEAWANLGFSLLMEYCDALDPEDLSRYQLGPLAISGFYRRPESLEARVRGVDEDIWWDAVGALREALRLEPELLLAKANLGIAYLVHPAGKQVGQATQFLEAAADDTLGDATLDPLAKASILLNASVADFSAGSLESSTQKLQLAQSHLLQSVGDIVLKATIGYQKALLLLGEGQQRNEQEALSLLETYLRATTPASAWWALAFGQYNELSRRLQRQPQTEADLTTRRHPGTQPFTSISLNGDVVVHLAQPLEEVLQQLEGERVTPLIDGTNLVRVSYQRSDLAFLGTHQVLAIVLLGPAAPTLLLHKDSTEGQQAESLQVGMSKGRLDSVLVGYDYDYRQLADPNVNYRFYTELGLAVRIVDGTITELVIARIPRRPIRF